MLADMGAAYPILEEPKAHEITPCAGQPSKNLSSETCIKSFFFLAHLVSFRSNRGMQKKVPCGRRKRKGAWASFMLGRKRN